MSNLLVKLGAGPGSHCVTLLDDISHHGPHSLSLVVGQHQVSFNTSIVCSLSPLLATLVKHSVEDGSCTAHDHFTVFLPGLRNWKTVKHMKAFLSSGHVENISKLDIEDLQNLLQLLGFSMSCEVQPALTVLAEGEDQEEQFYAEIKCEVEDESHFSTRIQLGRNDYEKLKNLITSGSSDLIDRNDEDVDIIHEVMDNEDIAINQGKDKRSETDANNHKTNSDSPYRNKAGFERPQRKLPIRKTKNSFWQMTKNECVKAKTEKKQWAISRKRKSEETRKGVEYRCSECDYKSRKRGHFKTHCEGVHDGVKYPCTECGYKATQRGRLNLHIKSVHEGVRFPCNECDYEAKYLATLKQHQQVIHKKIQYPCNQCDYKSPYMVNLKRHIQAVHDIILYSCSKCDFKATRKSTIVRHNKRFHKEAKYPDTKCVQ